MCIEQRKHSRFMILLVIANCTLQDNREQKDVLKDNKKEKRIYNVIKVKSRLIKLGISLTILGLPNQNLSFTNIEIIL